MKPEVKPSFISRQVLRGRYLFLDLSPPPETRFAVVCAGREECSPDHQIERNGFRYHAVEYVVSGRWELGLGHQRHELGPGSLFAYGPMTRYRLRALDRHHLVKFFVDFTGQEATALLKSTGLLSRQPNRVDHTRWLHDIFDQILDCANLARPAARRIGSHLTELLLMRVREDQRSSTAPHPESHGSYLRCRQFLQEHYLRARTVEGVASACNLAPAYLSRLFRRFADETPLQYLTRLKMDHAAELILRQGASVKQASAAVGFEDPYHFSRVFKRVHGVAPAHFARQ